jgi:hypothetical protein
MAEDLSVRHMVLGLTIYWTCAPVHGSMLLTHSSMRFEAVLLEAAHGAGTGKVTSWWCIAAAILLVPTNACASCLLPLQCAQLLELLQLLPPDPPTGTSLTGVLVTAPSGIPATTPGEARRGSQPGRRGSVPGTSDRRGSMSNTGTTSDRSSMPGNRRSSVSGTGDAGQTPVNGSIPVPPYSYKVEVASAFWCRVVDRDQGWADVMLSLTPGQQVSLSHRLGYANVFNPARPGMSYQLRMSRPDDHQVGPMEGWQKVLWRCLAALIHAHTVWVLETSQRGCQEGICYA